MNSLLSRVTRGTVLSASVAALVTAGATSVFAAWLVQRAEDRRLHDAAVVLADELHAGKHGSAQATVEDELRETSHMGLLFAVFDSSSLLAGDVRLPRVDADSCSSSQGLRSCAVDTASGQRVVAAGAHASVTGWLFVAALLSALLAAVGAVVASRPVARALVSPLSRLRARLEGLDLARVATVDLGAREDVEEIDQLRDALATLLHRLGGALQQAERFSANAAHELRTPLTSIRGQLELLDEQPERAAQTLASTRKTVTRLELLVERLLVLATPHDAPQPSLEMVSLRDALEDVTQTLPEADQRRVELVIVEDAAVRADAALVHTLVSNALSNALKFGVRVTVRLNRVGDFARLLVEDDGPGVPLSERARVFEPFHRLDAGGHGLGLALIAHLARRYGGTAQFLDFAHGAQLEITMRSVP